MKNVLINIPNLRKEHGGIYQYTIALLKILAKINMDFKFIILCDLPDDDLKMIVSSAKNLEFTNTETPVYSKYTLFMFRVGNYLFKRVGVNKRFYAKDLYDCIINDYKINIIHSPTQTIISKECIKSITTLHDVQELHFPEFFTSKERASRAVLYKKAIDGADGVVVSYNHVKEDIITYFSKPKDKIHTILLDMQELWFDNIISNGKQILEVYNLPKKYILYPASTWEHKNHIRLLEALRKLNNPEIQLVCTGHQTDYFSKRILPYIEVQNLENKVKFLGIVSDEVLFELYHNCEAVVIPTLYEAGSFPLMESILMNIPVICSNVTSLPETIGDERFVFNPLDIEDIANKVYKIWSDTEYKKENREVLKIQAQKLKNNNAVAKLCKLYESL